MKFKALENNIVVEEQKEEETGFISISESFYKKGRVVSIGGLVPEDIQQGALIVYPSNKSNQLGLGFPDTCFVVNFEDVVGVIYEE